MTLNTTFIFVSSILKQGYLSMVFDKTQQVISQPQVLDFASLYTQQSQYPGKTILVLSSQLATLQLISLPRLPDKKARLAIPFALEDNLAQPLESLHFAFSNTFHENGHYLVAVIEKNIIESLIKQFEQHQIRFDTITLDWFALLPGEISCMPDYALIHNSTFHGALTYPLLTLSKNELTSACSHIYCFSDSGIQENSIPPERPLQTENMPSYTWIAKRLLNQPCINFCQEKFLQNPGQHRLKQWYRYAGYLTLSWLLSLIILMLIHWFSHQKEIRQLDEKIGIVYHQLFPQAQQVINPRFRISQYLKTTQNTSNDIFWKLLSKFSSVLNNTKIEVTHLQWQNGNLQIQCTTSDFTVLNQLEEQLKKAGLKVKQNQAATENESIHSTLELSL